MAFFQLGARPAAAVRRRRALPRTFKVLTRMNLDLEQLLHGMADFRLVGARIGHDGVLIILVRLPGAFFGQANGFDDFKRVHVIPCSGVARRFQTRLV